MEFYILILVVLVLWGVYTVIIILVRDFPELKNKYKISLDEIKKQKKKINEIEKNNELLTCQNSTLSSLLKTKTPFTDVARMKADFETAVFKDVEHYLRFKPHPATKAADEIKSIKNELREVKESCNFLFYQQEYLSSIFPELRPYLYDDEALLNLRTKKKDYTFDDTRDRVLDWIEEEDYRRLSVDDRNQLALERYKKRHKTNWEAGVEYENYISYLLRKEGYVVEQYGLLNGVNDLGRDIIAIKNTPRDVGGCKSIYIIQCKRYAEASDVWIVRENTICQTFGTAKVYEMSNNLSPNDKLVPVIATTKDLTNTASNFADLLGVEIWIKSMGEYPMIKCNINRSTGEKIYHLPFDQQYDRVELKYDGEFYAFTVKEAVSKGFRRAMRHYV